VLAGHQDPQPHLRRGQPTLPKIYRLVVLQELVSANGQRRRTVPRMIAARKRVAAAAGGLAATAGSHALLEDLGADVRAKVNAD
jgi:hypothetical protein